MSKGKQFRILRHCGHRPSVHPGEEDDGEGLERKRGPTSTGNGEVAHVGKRTRGAAARTSRFRHQNWGVKGEDSGLI